MKDKNRGLFLRNKRHYIRPGTILHTETSEEALFIGSSRFNVDFSKALEDIPKGTKKCWPAFEQLWNSWNDEKKKQDSAKFNHKANSLGLILSLITIMP